MIDVCMYGSEGKGNVRENGSQSHHQGLGKIVSDLVLGFLIDLYLMHGYIDRARLHLKDFICSI